MDASVAKPHWLFTPEMAKQAVQKRIDKLAAEKAAVDAVLSPKVSDALLQANASEAFRMLSANRTRDQMKAIQGKIDSVLKANKIDSKVLKELTEALARLETIEQKLSGRASPGSLRPTTKAGRRNAESPNPVTDPTPANGETSS